MARERLDQTFEVVGTVTWKKDGINKSGNPYFMVKVSGMTHFVDKQIYDSCGVGDRVQLHGECIGTKPGSYDPDLQYDGLLVLADVDSPIGTPPAAPAFAVNGNGHKLEKGAPA